MSDLNEKISAWFEPKPTFDNRLFHHDGMLSDRGAWWRPLADALHDYETLEPRPLDYFTDEAANARLLEAAKIHLWPTDGSPGGQGWAATSYLHLEARTPTDRPIVNFHADRKTAVVMAFCKWAGIPCDQ